MRWILDKEKIVSALQSLIGVVEKVSVVPITTNVKLVLSGNQISLTATDTKLQIKCVLPLPSDQNIDEPLATTVSAQKLLDSCLSAKNSDIIFHLEGEKLTVSFNNGNFILHTLSAERFPEIDEPTSEGSPISLPQKIWKEMISASIFVVPDRDYREAHKGLLLEVEDNQVRMVGTDGHRLSIVETQTDVEIGGEIKKAIIPKKAVLEMQRLFNSGSDELLTLYINDRSHVTFALENQNITFTSNLIEADFPEFKSVMPAEDRNRLILDKQEFSQSLARAVVIQRDIPRTVSLEIKKENVEIHCRNHEGEESSLVIDADFDGEEISMSFNENFLQGALKALLSGRVTLGIGGAHDSILIKEIGVVSRINVIMPLTP